MCNSYILFCLRNTFTHRSCLFFIYYFSFQSYLFLFFFSVLFVALEQTTTFLFFLITQRERNKEQQKKHTYIGITHIHTERQKKSTTMNNNVLTCLITNEQDSYGLTRRLALTTGRLPVESSLTLKGLKYNK